MFILYIKHYLHIIIYKKKKNLNHLKKKYIFFFFFNYFHYLSYFKNIYFFYYRINYKNNLKVIKKKNKSNNKIFFIYTKNYYKKFNKYINDKFLFSTFLYENKYYYFKYFLYFFFENKKYTYNINNIKKSNKSNKRMKKNVWWRKNKKTNFFEFQKDLFLHTNLKQFNFFNTEFNTVLYNDFSFLKSNLFFFRYKNKFFLKKKFRNEKKKFKRINFNFQKYISFFNFFYKKKLFNFFKSYKKNLIVKDNNMISLLEKEKIHFLKRHYMSNFLNMQQVHDSTSLFDNTEYTTRFLFKNLYLYYFFKFFKKRIKVHFISNLFNIFFSIKKERLVLKKKLTLFLNLSRIGIVTYKNTLRNVFLTLSANNGKHLYHISSGHLKFFGRKKVYYKTIFNLTRRFLYKIPFFLRQNNIFFVKIVITGYFNDMFNFIRPFFKRSYYFQQYHQLFKNYLLFLKKYILFIKNDIMSRKNVSILNFNKYINILFRCYYLSNYMNIKLKKKKNIHFKLLYIQIKSNKFFSK